MMQRAMWVETLLNLYSSGPRNFSNSFRLITIKGDPSGPPFFVHRPEVPHSAAHTGHVHEIGPGGAFTCTHLVGKGPRRRFRRRYVHKIGLQVQYSGTYEICATREGRIHFINGKGLCFCLQKGFQSGYVLLNDSPDGFHINLVIVVHQYMPEPFYGGPVYLWVIGHVLSYITA